MRSITQICDIIRQTAFDLHVYLGHGHLEKVYENGLTHRLQKVGLRAVQQSPLSVFDEDETRLGDYFADILVDDRIILELKATQSLRPEHEAQILGYLKASRIQHGMLINFGSFQFQIRKFVWTHPLSSRGLNTAQNILRP